MTNLNESIGSIVSKGGKWRARLIEANVKGSSAYYPAEALEAGAHLFKAGTQMFNNHLSSDEQWSRPEGDVNNLVGVLESDAVFEEDGLYADLKIFSHKKDWLKEVAPYVGLSIRAQGVVEEDDQGVPVLQSFTNVLSVDVVTRAGAGGKFVSLAESAKPGVLEETTNTPLDESKEETMEFPAELAEALDTQAKDVKALTEAVTALVEGLKPVEVVVEETKLSTAEVVEALVEAGLGKTARARAIASVEAGTELAEAIKAEVDLKAEILEEAKTAAPEFKANIEESAKEAQPLIKW